MGGIMCPQQSHGDEWVPFKDTGNKACVLSVGLNYDYSEGNELTGIFDAKNMYNISIRSGSEDPELITDEDLNSPGLKPTKEGVSQAIRQVAAKCGEGDWFVFFYAGHGMNVPDQDGDESDGMDEAMVTVGPAGQIAEKYFFVDDDFADCLDRSVPPGVRILVITDCCHSGTIVDLNSHMFEHDREICAIAAAQDNEEAGDTSTYGGKGGVLTNSIASALGHLAANRSEEYSIQEVFDLTKRYAASNRSRNSEVSIDSAGMDPANYAWPLFDPQFTFWQHFG